MNSMNGLLLVDKPVGLTSHDVVYRMRRLLGVRQIGHAGTLDPLASGLLILLIGEATKLSDYLLNGDKAYEVKVRLGIHTDSMDITGQRLFVGPCSPGAEPVSEDEAETLKTNPREVVGATMVGVQKALESLAGELNLEVPLHSAVKVSGKKLYEYAHRGESPEHAIPKRKMNFYDVELLDFNNPFVKVGLRCSKGSFVRSWAHQMGEIMNCGGVVEELRRTVSAPWRLAGALTWSELEKRWSERKEATGDAFGAAWVPLAESLPHFYPLHIHGRDETFMRNGQISQNLQVRLLASFKIGEKPPPIRVISQETGDLIAILLADDGEFYRIKRVFKAT